MGKKSKKKNRHHEKAKKLSLVDWFKQNIGLALLLLASIILPFITSSTILDQSLLPKFLILALFLSLIAITAILSKQLKTKIFVLDIVFLSYTLWQVLSIIWAFNFAEAVFSASTTVLFFLSYCFAKSIFINNENTERLLLPAFGLSAFALVSYGWFEFFTTQNVVGTNNMVYAVKGFAAHKNLFVLQLFLHLPFLIIGFLKTQKKLKYGYLLIALLILLLLISLLARAFMVGFLASSFTAFVLWIVSREKGKTTFNWKPFAIALPIILLFVIGIFSLRGGVQMLNRYNVFNFKESRNAQERLALWTNTIELIKNKPVLGYGAGNWDVFFPSTGIQNIRRMSIGSKTVSRPHNDYLWIAAETGIIGLALYLSVLVAVYFISLKALWAFKNNVTNKKILITLISFFTGYLVIAFFDFPKERIELNFLVAILIAWIVFYSSKQSNSKTLLSFNGVPSCLLSLSTLLILVGLVYIGGVRYKGEQKSVDIKKYLSAQQFDKVLQLSPIVKHALYNIDPAETPVEYYTCLAHFGQKDYDKAATFGELALLDSPYHVKTLKKVAAAYGELKQYENAIPHFETARQINSDDELSKEGLAISYYNSDQKEKAKAVVQTLQSEHPSIQEMRRQFNLN